MLLSHLFGDSAAAGAGWALGVVGELPRVFSSECDCGSR